MPAGKRIPRIGNKVDLQVLMHEVDWDRLTELEQIILGNQPPNFRRLVEEIKSDPSVAQLAWGDNNETLLHLAAGEDQPALAELLLQFGADVNAMDALDGTPLHFAAGVGSLEGVK